MGGGEAARSTGSMERNMKNSFPPGHLPYRVPFVLRTFESLRPNLLRVLPSSTPVGIFAKMMDEREIDEVKYT